MNPPRRKILLDTKKMSKHSRQCILSYSAGVYVVVLK